MKSAVCALLLLPLVIFSNLSAQTSSSCAVPAPLRDNYARDVANLAVEQMFQAGSPDTLMVHIPNQWTDPIWEGLAAIYNVAGIPERDSVYDHYCVHDNNYQRQNFSSYLVQVDTTLAWTQAWQNLNAITGNAQIDDMVTKYDLRVAQFYNWSIGNYAEIATDSIWNDYGLMDSLRLVNGVVSVEQNQIIGAAGVITYDLTVDGRRYDFYLEFNDCFDGCDNYRKWKFLVAPNCDVTYLGFDDWWTFNHDPLPAPTNCNISNSLPEPVGGSFEIFPNPSRDRIWLDYSDPHAVYSMRIYDMLGKVVKQRDEVRSRDDIYVGSLPPGSYVVRLNGLNGEMIARRLVKRGQN